MALAMRMRAGQHLDGADRVDPDLRRFPQADAGAERAHRRRRGDAARLDIGREADAAQLAAPLRLARAGREALVVGDLQRLVERRAVVARVVAHDHGRLMRKARDEVAPAELGGILAAARAPPPPSAARPRRSLPAARRPGRRRPARCSCRRRRPRRRSPGCCTGPTAAAHRDRSGSTTRRSTGRRRDWRSCVPAAPGSCPRRRVASFGMGDVVAAVRVGQEGLGAVAGPFHRAADLLGGPDADRLLGVDEDLRAEAAADVRRDDPQLVLGRDADEGREHEPRHVRVLAGRVEREGLRAGVIVADRGARLHRVRDQPVVDDLDLGDMRCVGEGRVGRGLVAQVPVEHRVVRARRRAPAERPGGRLGSVDHRGSTSYSTLIFSAASFAFASLSATTTATWSPT